MAIVAAAVVVVSLVVGGVVLLTRDSGDPVADPSTSASRSTSPAKPTTSRPAPTSRPTPTSTHELDYGEARAFAEAAFPPAGGYDLEFCADGYFQYDAVVALGCFNDAGDYFFVYAWNDTETPLRSIRGYYTSFDESTWGGGTEFRHDAPGIYHAIVRCYAEAPVCIEVFEDTKAEADAVLGHFSYLDSAGIAALNDRLTDAGV